MNLKEDVKIVYCYDENNNPVHYSKTIKGSNYFCIDCGSELVCKDGDIKVKHLAHKNTDNCGGTGESIFHKHWKENLFKVGMFINIANKLEYPKNVEILDVINEVSLSNRYEKVWDRDIIVDVLLITDIGDIVIEINYKNPKNWKELEPYYKELDLLRVFEVKVGKNVNTQLEWSYLGEKEDTVRIQQEINKENKRLKLESKKAEEEKKKARDEKRIERQRLKDEALRVRWQNITEMVEIGTYIETKITMNFKTPLKCVGDGIYEIKCLHLVNPIKNRKYEKIVLRFELERLNITKAKIEKLFNITKGIKYSFIIFDKNMSSDGYYDVVNLEDVYVHNYDKTLYAKLCNIN